MDDIILRVQEADAVTLKYVEAKLKPEVVGHATPTEEAQTVTPAPGTTFSAVEVDAIPPEYIIPSGTKNINENGEHDVSGFAVAEVAVPPPTLQQKTITPNESEQIVEADSESGYDGLSRVTVNRIPQEYIVPSGTLNITEDSENVNVIQYATASVRTAPTKGFVLGGWDENGKPTIAKIVGFTDVPNLFFDSLFRKTVKALDQIDTVYFSAEITRLRDYAVRYCNAKNVIFEGDCPFLGNGAFNNNQTDVFDFSHAENLPPNLASTLNISIHAGTIFRIPYALSDDFLGAGNGWQSLWSAFPTDPSLSAYVVWDVVNNAQS